MAHERATGGLNMASNQVRLRMSLRSGWLWIGKLGWIVPVVKHVSRDSSGRATIHFGAHIRRWHPVFWLWLWSQRRQVERAVIEAIELVGDDVLVDKHGNSVD